MKKSSRLIVLFLGICLAFPAPASAFQIGSWIRALLGMESRVINEQHVSFTVPPKTAGRAYVQFLALGDFGSGNGDQRAVAAAMAATSAKDPVSFIVSVGDNIYESGVTSVTDPQWKTKFEMMYDQPSLSVPFYAVFGNHDVRSNAQAQIDYTTVSRHWKMPAEYYTFTASAATDTLGMHDSTSVQFFCINTNPIAYLSAAEASALPDTGAERRQLHWLDSALARSTARWRVVVGHHTIYSGGEHGDNPVLQDLLQPILARNRVDVYLCGHDHHLEMIRPVQGIHYVISGAGGKSRDVTWRENTIFAATNNGFNLFRAGSSELLVEFLDRNGTVIFARSIPR
jgi:acid phosphatase